MHVIASQADLNNDGKVARSEARALKKTKRPEDQKII
jgi:hypothetical protein